jgi:hypothetical protein
VFVVVQVDENGNVIEGAYINAVSDSYKEESLKALAKSKAPECIREAILNGRYKAQQF